MKKYLSKLPFVFLALVVVLAIGINFYGGESEPEHEAIKLEAIEQEAIEQEAIEHDAKIEEQIQRDLQNSDPLKEPTEFPDID